MIKTMSNLMVIMTTMKNDHNLDWMFFSAVFVETSDHKMYSAHLLLLSCFIDVSYGDSDLVDYD